MGSIALHCVTNADCFICQYSLWEIDTGGAGRLTLHPTKDKRATTKKQKRQYRREREREREGERQRERETERERIITLYYTISI